MENNIKNQKDSFGRTALMYATLEGDDNKVKVLIDSGVDVNALDNNGFSALHFAAQEYRVNPLNLLVEAGAKIDVPDKFGNTPLFTATFNSRGQGEIIKLLLERGADRNFKNTSGVSPLDLAEKIANYDIRQFFK